MINVYLRNNPAYLNSPEKFTVGYIDSDGTLIDITTSCDIVVTKPSMATVVDVNTLLVQSENQVETVEMQITYLTNPVEYIYFTVVEKPLDIKEKNILSTLKRYLPQNVYSSKDSALSNDKFKAIATVLYSLYNNGAISNPEFSSLIQVVNDFYPESGYSAWEEYLVGTNSLYAQSISYGKLLQLYYETNINNSTNPYYYAYNLSRYIYYRLGEKYYIYIGENTVQFGKNFILNNNSLGFCTFLGNINGSTPSSINVYVIDGSVLPLIFQQEFNQFARRICKAGVLLNVIYDNTFADFQLTDIGYTYHNDPRQQNTYCIEFEENELAQAKGYTGGININSLISFEITLSPTPPTPTTLDVGITYAITIVPTWAGTPPVIDLTPYSDFFSSDENVATMEQISGVQYVIAEASGSFTMNAYCGPIFNSYTYTVS